MADMEEAKAVGSLRLEEVVDFPFGLVRDDWGREVSESEELEGEVDGGGLFVEWVLLFRGVVEEMSTSSLRKSASSSDSARPMAGSSSVPSSDAALDDELE